MNEDAKQRSAALWRALNARTDIEEKRLELERHTVELLMLCEEELRYLGGAPYIALGRKLQAILREWKELRNG